MDRTASSYRARYLALRRRMGRLRSSNYDISSICNLRCEGCLFFSGAAEESLREEKAPEAWRAFFKSEADRGVNFAYLAGAEPSLTPDRIRACHESIPYGVVMTNGTKRVDPDIRYRIHVSLWGEETSSTLYRGADVNRRAFRNYAGDPRAVFVMMLHRLNLNDVTEVARRCADNGVQLTFNLFSPTTDYLERIETREKSDFFRVSAEAPSMGFDADTLQRARMVMSDAAERFPDTVRTSPAYSRWVTQAGPLHHLDENGVATDCGNRLTGWHRHYNADLSENTGKCCSPNIDCSGCRAYLMSLATYLKRFMPESGSEEINEDWLAVWEFWASLFLPVEAVADASYATDRPNASNNQPA
ncbi:MAG: radical SAM protein [Oceanicaulis sp.]